MAKIGQVVARRMTAGKPNHVHHIAQLQWGANDGSLVWSTREVMVSKVDGSTRGTFFTEVDGYTAALYSVHHNGNSWVQTEPDETKVDNLLRLPLG